MLRAHFAIPPPNGILDAAIKVRKVSFSPTQFVSNHIIRVRGVKGPDGIAPTFLMALRKKVQ